MIVPVVDVLKVLYHLQTHLPHTQDDRGTRFICVQLRQIRADFHDLEDACAYLYGSITEYLEGIYTLEDKLIFDGVVEADDSLFTSPDRFNLFQKHRHEWIKAQIAKYSQPDATATIPASWDLSYFYG